MRAIYPSGSLLVLWRRFTRHEWFKPSNKTRQQSYDHGSRMVVSVLLLSDVFNFLAFIRT
jgi:hypothetical protein